MAVGIPVIKQSPVSQVLHNGVVGVFDELAGKGIVAGNAAAQVHRLDKGQFPVAAQAQVLVAKSRGDMHQAGAILEGYKVAGHYPGIQGGDGFQFGHRCAAGAGTADKAANFRTIVGRRVERPIAGAYQIGALDGSHYPIFLPQSRFQQFRRQNQPLRLPLPFQLDDGVVGGGGHGQGGVAGQGPGGGRPSQQVGGDAAVPGQAGGRFGQQELDKHRRIGRVFLIAEGYFVGAEAGFAAGAVGSAAQSFVKEALIPQLLDNPPAGFDKVVVQGDIGMFHIDPEADPVGQFLPLLDIAEHAFPALAVEVLDAVLLDFPLGTEAQFLFDFQFHGQAVGIPAALAEAAVAFHGAVAADDILKDAGQDVVDAGAAVGRGRAFVEHKEGSVGAFRLRAAENIPLLPVLQDPGIQFRHTDAAGYGREHCRQTSTG